MGAAFSSQSVAAALGIAGATTAGATLLTSLRRMRSLRHRHLAHATDGRVFLVVNFEVKPANEAAFFTELSQVMSGTLKEPGCIKYQMTQPVDGPAHTYTLIEEWSSKQALADHNETPHFKRHVPRMAELAKITFASYAPLDVTSKL